MLQAAGVTVSRFRADAQLFQDIAKGAVPLIHRFGNGASFFRKQDLMVFSPENIARLFQLLKGNGYGGPGYAQFIGQIGAMYVLGFGKNVDCL